MAEEAGHLTLPAIPKDVLKDLCSRFLINIPITEKISLVRICFQIELAHWYYIDFCRQDDPDLPACGMKAFIAIVFTEFEFLNKSKQSVQTIYENWKKYKIRVPVYGAILLDDKLENCLLVQGFHNKTSWGFPKGKVNKDENGVDCAIREVWEETGYDITPIVHPNQYIENTIHDHQVRLYIVAGIEKAFNFKPNTRGEIKEIRWFPVQHLPTHKKDPTPKEEFNLLANNFFMIHTFIKPLRKWIQEKKDCMEKFPTPPIDSYKDRNMQQLKKEQAEKFRQMHLFNEQFLGKENEETILKSMLGLNVQDERPVSPRPQPEIIRKLLTGNLDVSPHRNKRTTQLYSSKVVPRQESPWLNYKLAKSKYETHNTLSKSVECDFATQDSDVPYKLNQRQDSMKFPARPLHRLSDFTFKAPAFINFRFDYGRILSQLM